MKNKILCLMLAVIMCISCLAGCVGGGGEETPEETPDAGNNNGGNTGNGGNNNGGNSGNGGNTGNGSGDIIDGGETETNWWDDITYDQTSIIFQLNDGSNHGELLSGSKRYLAGEDQTKTEWIDTLVAKRNEAAYANTKVNVSYAYYPEAAEHYFSKSYKVMIENINEGGAYCPDIFCNWMTDMLLLSLNEKLANLYTRDAKYGDNYFDINIPDDAVAGQSYNGYMAELMGSLTLSSDKVYVVASDYFIDLIRSFFVVPVNIKLFNQAAQEVGLEDLNGDDEVDINDFFEEVKNGDWTYDRLIQYSDAAYFDTNGDETKNVGDQLGFALGKNGLPAAGLIYTTNVEIIDRNTQERTYSYPPSNPTLVQIFGAISNMLGQEGIMCITSADAGLVGYTDDGCELLSVRHKFAADELLFGGIILVGSLEDSIYQDMNKKTGGGFGVVPVPLWTKYETKEDGSQVQIEYLTQIHVVGRAGGIRVNTQKFSQCSAFLQYQSTHSNEILNHYYDVTLTVGAAGNLDGNAEMLQYIRENVRTSFDKLYEDAIGFMYDNGISAEDRYHSLLCDKNFDLSAEDFAAFYDRTLPLKVENLESLVKLYVGLPA